MNTISTRKHNKLHWLPSLFFALAIFSFSSTPGKEITKSYQEFKTTIQTITPTAIPETSAVSTQPSASSPVKIDWLKAAHGIGYFCLGVSVLYALSFKNRWNPSIALLLCSFYSVTDEFHQVFTPGRSGSSRDILLDTLAALIGVSITLGAVASKNFFNPRKGSAD